MAESSLQSRELKSFPKSNLPQNTVNTWETGALPVDSSSCVMPVMRWVSIISNPLRNEKTVQWCWLDHLQDEVLNSPVTPASRLTCTVQVEGAVHAVPWFWFLVGYLCVICCLVRHLAGYTLSIYWFGMRYRTEPLRHGIHFTRPVPETDTRWLPWGRLVLVAYSQLFPVAGMQPFHKLYDTCLLLVCNVCVACMQRAMTWWVFQQLGFLVLDSY